MIAADQQAGDWFRPCAMCRLSFPVVDFYARGKRPRDGKKYRNAYCCGCMVLWTNNARRSRSSVARGARDAWYRTKYGEGITPLGARLQEQRGCCGICQTPIAFAFDALVDDARTVKATARVDHCHITGKVRGLLCQKCNHGLGQFKDDPALLRLALAYLEKPR